MVCRRRPRAASPSQRSVPAPLRAPVATDSVDDDAAKGSWWSQLQERIAAPKSIAATLSGEALLHQCRRITRLLASDSEVSGHYYTVRDEVWREAVLNRRTRSLSQLPI